MVATISNQLDDSPDGNEIKMSSSSARLAKEVLQGRILGRAPTEADNVGVMSRD